MKSRVNVLLWALIAHSLILFSAGRAEAVDASRAGRFYFGWAGTSITPDAPVAIGGQYHTRISGEVHDPLTATALAVETRDEAGVIDQAVFVSCDLSVIRRKVCEDVRRRDDS